MIMRNLKKTIVSVGLGLVFVTLFVGNLTAQDQQVFAQNHSRTCCLWKIQTSTNRVYLLGSIHILKKENFPLRPPIYQAMQDASHVVFEVNPKNLVPERSSLQMLKMGVLTNGKTIKDYLSPKTYETAKTQLQQRGYQIEPFATFKPWFLALTITAMEMQKMGLDPDIGVDKHLFELAKQQKKSIDGLETFEDQIRIFNDMSPKTQDMFVLQSFSELAMMKSEVNDLMKAWVQGRAEGLEVMLKSMQDYPEVFHALITERNKNWMSQIESFLRSRDNYLVVVGTLHLLGEKGLLAMLREKGWKIESM